MFRVTRLRRTLLNEINENSLKALQCGICTDYMVPPIYVCRNNHSICRDCKVKISLCPYCRDTITSNTNQELEDVARKTMYPCIYRMEGCAVTCNVDEIYCHTNDCPFRLYLCPLKDSDKCSWNGRKSELKPHLKLKHLHRTMSFNTMTVVTFTISNHTIYVPEHCYIIFFKNGIFYRSFFVKRRQFCCYVQYIGPDSRSYNFVYKLTFQGHDGIKYLKTRHRVLSLSNDVDSALSQGDMCRIPFPLALQYENNQLLKVQFELFKV